MTQAAIRKHLAFSWLVTLRGQCSFEYGNILKHHCLCRLLIMLPVGWIVVPSIHLCISGCSCRQFLIERQSGAQSRHEWLEMLESWGKNANSASQATPGEGMDKRHCRSGPFFSSDQVAFDGVCIFTWHFTWLLRFPPASQRCSAWSVNSRLKGSPHVSGSQKNCL